MWKVIPRHHGMWWVKSCYAGEINAREQNYDILSNPRYLGEHEGIERDRN